MNLKEAAQQALEVLETWTPSIAAFIDRRANAITALRAALAQQENEQPTSVQALMTMQKELQWERDYWEQEARRYASNAEFWKSKQQEQDTECRTCGGKGCVACDARHPVNQELLGAMKDFGGSDA